MCRRKEDWQKKNKKNEFFLKNPSFIDLCDVKAKKEKNITKRNSEERRTKTSARKRRKKMMKKYFNTNTQKGLEANSIQWTNPEWRLSGQRKSIANRYETNNNSFTANGWLYSMDVAGLNDGILSFCMRVSVWICCHWFMLRSYECWLK